MEKLAAANEGLKAAHDTREHEYKNAIAKLDTKEKQLLDRLKALDEKKLKVSEINGDVDVTESDRVEINAGGKIIAVTRSTLTQFKGTRLEALFSGRWDKKLQKDTAGRIFLDVNPLCFQAIVDYLNEVKISSDESPAAPPSVDAEYNDILLHQLNLFGLSEIVHPVEVPDSKIIQEVEHVKILDDWSVPYRISRDGRNGSTLRKHKGTYRFGNTYEPAPSQLSDSRTLNIKEMEVFQVLQQNSSSKPKKHKDTYKVTKATSISTPDHKIVQKFSASINAAMNKKWATLAEVDQEVTALEASFEDEEKFIKFLSSGKDQDIITLNVCGTAMATTRQTIQFCKDSILAANILETDQDEDSTGQKPVRDWNTEDVIAWLNTIDGLSPSIVSSFEYDEVTGRELLALGREDLNYFGITKRGTIAYFLSEVKKLERAHCDAAVLIEHSPYCFEKIIDHLRLESLFVKGLVETKPGMPNVKGSEKSRFEKVVKHYFPGDSSKALIGK